MKHFFRFKLLAIASFMSFGSVIQAQEYDILIKNGHLIDPKNDIDQKMDIAVTDGKVVRVASKTMVQRPL